MVEQIHYVYKITNNNPVDERRFYIGVRSTRKKNYKYDKYMGSSKYLSKAIQEIGISYFSKEILSTWETRELADKEESRLHKLLNVSKDPSYYNRHNAGETGFNNVGLVTVYDVIETSYTQIPLDIYHNNKKRFLTTLSNKVSAKNIKTGEIKQIDKKIFDSNDNWVGNTTEQVTVKDKTTNKYKNISKTEFDNNPGLYDGTTKGQVTVLDTRDNTTKNVTKEEFNNNDYYQSIHINTVSVIDTRDNTTKRVSKSDYEKFDFYVSVKSGTYVVIDIRNNIKKQVSKNDYYKYDYYVSPISKIIDIYNNNGDLVMTSIGSFKRFCDDNNLSYQRMCESYKANGKPLFLNISKIGLNRLKRNNKDFQIGWYAKIREII